MPAQAIAMESTPAETRAAPAETPLVRVRSLVKTFGGVRALAGVDLDVLPGEVHGLVGANGAGKSTLIKILAGVEQPDDGAIEIAGEATVIPTPQRATALGLSFIHQELNLVPHFTAIENMTLGLSKPTRAGLIDWRRVKMEAASAAERLGIDFPLDTPISELSVAEQWTLSIGRALVRRARLIAMDEPTASLSAEESERLFQIIRELSNDGISILYVSHRLEEILDLCDTATVFKDGQHVLHQRREDMTKESLVRGIVGSDLAELGGATTEHHDAGKVILTLDHIGRPPRVRDVSLTLRAGEVLGLAGLVGAGRTELARVIFGVDAAESGNMTLEGKPYRPADPAAAVHKGVVLVPEERRSEGLVLDQSVSFNLNLPFLQPVRVLPGLPLVSTRRSNTRANAIMERLQIKAESVDTPVRQLSGGNQQKVVIGKWLTLTTKVLDPRRTLPRRRRGRPTRDPPHHPRAREPRHRGSRHLV